MDSAIFKSTAIKIRLNYQFKEEFDQICKIPII